MNRVWEETGAFQIDSFPALLLTDDHQRVLVVGDLHIGWELSLSRVGIHIPSQTSRLIERMERIIQVSKPSRLILLGDVKHTVSGAELEEWRDVPTFFEKMNELVPEIEVIAGNHDGNLEPMTPSTVKFHASGGVALWERFGLFHGHAWPDAELLSCPYLIMSHLHPVVTFRDKLGFYITRQVWLKAKCDPQKLAAGILKNLRIRVEGDPIRTVKSTFGVECRIQSCLILPSFNDYLGGQPVNESADRGARDAGENFIGPLLRAGVVDIACAEVHLMDGTYLGTVTQIRFVK